MVTVRSAARGQMVTASIPADRRHRVSFAVIDDVGRTGALDDVLMQSVRCSQPFDYVLHTASPYQLHFDDPLRGVLLPAVRGTMELLRAVDRLQQSSAPTIRRVVLTSSSAAMLRPGDHPPVYDESIWRPMSSADAVRPENTYEASKIVAERAAWAYANTGAVTGSSALGDIADDIVDDVVALGGETGETADQPGGNASRATTFDLAVINCTYTFGPVQRWLTRAADVNASNRRICDALQGRWHGDAGGVPPTRPVFTFVDVRDVARAHIAAMEAPGAGGRRFYVVGGHFSNARIATILAQACPDRLRPDLPSDGGTQDDLPPDVYQFDNTRARALLGMDAYVPLVQSVTDTMQSLLAQVHELRGAAS